MVRFQVVQENMPVISRLSFNSKMVRFQASTQGRRLLRSSVSIPKWCDSKPVRHSFGRNMDSVSIPKWCDSKLHWCGGKKGEECFNSKMVRFQGVMTNPLKLFKAVSIPKWCDSKLTAFESRITYAKFQFQNGAIPRWECGRSARADICFNSKMVRFQVKQ